MDGLSKFNIIDAVLKMPTMKNNNSVSLTWPKLEGKTKYSIDAILAEKLPIYGEGEIE